MRRRPGYLRICNGVFRSMVRHASGSRLVPWTALGVPATAWLLVGGGGEPVLPLLISGIAWCWPASIMIGWSGSEQRASLVEILYGSRAGRYSLVIPELLLPMLLGAVPALAVALMAYSPAGMTWQLWTVIPFTSLMGAGVTFLLGRYLGGGGHALNLLAFLSQASCGSWTASGLFQLLLPQGYVLWTLEWMNQGQAAFHGDIYAFFAVIAGTGFTVLAGRMLSIQMS